MTTTVPREMIENHTFDEIAIGDTAHLTRTLRAEDIRLFAAMSGDVNPSQVDADCADSRHFHGLIAHSMWGAALISTVLGTEYPGPGATYLSQNLRFLRPVHIGDTLDVRVTVSSKEVIIHQVVLACHCSNQHGDDVITGSAVVLAPAEKIRRPRLAPMQVRLSERTHRYRQLLTLTEGLVAIQVAVVHPCSEEALRGAIEAAEMGLIRPVLVGPEEKIRAVAAQAQIDLTGHRIAPAAHKHAAAALAVTMARSGEVQALMKGSLHTDELMTEAVKADGGLRTERRVSHIFVLDVPSYPKPLLIRDAAINFEPDLNAKRDIVRNAIDLAHALGIAQPLVASLAAVETVNPRMRSTLDAAALCKMAEREQITGDVLDGPLAFDNAISAQAALDKGIMLPVAGQAHILIAPRLEAAHMIAKQLQHLADAQAAGLVMRARVLIILTSRADGATARVASCALALLVVAARSVSSAGKASA